MGSLKLTGKRTTGSDAAGRKSPLRLVFKKEEISSFSNLEKVDGALITGKPGDDKENVIHAFEPLEDVEMPVLKPHFESKEFRKIRGSKVRRRPMKISLVNVVTNEPVGKTRQMWCKFCDNFYPTIDILKYHIVNHHRTEPVGLNEHTIATWDILDLVGLPPNPPG